MENTTLGDVKYNLKIIYIKSKLSESYKKAIPKIVPWVLSLKNRSYHHLLRKHSWQVLLIQVNMILINGGQTDDVILNIKSNFYLSLYEKYVLFVCSMLFINF